MLSTYHAVSNVNISYSILSFMTVLHTNTVICTSCFLERDVLLSCPLLVVFTE